MSRRAVTAVICMVLATTLAACGTTDEEAGSGPASPDAPANAANRAVADDTDENVPRAPTTSTKKPRNKIRQQPDCRAYHQFSFINAMVALAKPEQRESVILKLQVSANTMKGAAPQFAEKVDRVYALSVKSANERLSDEERAEFRALLDEMGAWNQATCIIEPGSPEYDG